MLDKSLPNTEFERSKIYEKLQYLPEPSDYHGKIPWIVQQQISATNGIQYSDRVGKLKEYPRYQIPIRKKKGGIFLDIGTGWGRWLVGAAEKGYIPIGIDLRLEFCITARNTLKAAELTGYSIVADLKELPFIDNAFDQIWSFSVIQHTHKERMIACLKEIKRILKPGGATKIEFPNKNGIRNKLGPTKAYALEANDYNSWVVRYYSISDYKNIFLGIFKNFRFTNHSFLGIGVLKEDIKYVSFKNKILCTISLFCSFLTLVIPLLKTISDSIYIEAKKVGQEINNSSVENFIKAHKNNPNDNLNIVHLLRCPISGHSLELSNDRSFVYTKEGNIKYPIIQEIPVLIRSEIKLI